jgi:multidrug resistance efflux pump
MHQNKIQAEMQLEQMKAQIEDQKMQHEMVMKSQEMASKEQFERWKAELDAATKIMVAQIGAKATMDQAALSAEQAAADELQSVGAQDNASAQMIDMHGQTLDALRGVMETLAKPKTIIRGPDGRVAGVQ